MPASLLPQAENRERGQAETRRIVAVACYKAPCPEKDERASKASSLPRWRRANRAPSGQCANGVGERTAQRWAKEPEVRAEVESFRRGTLDQAVGQMSTRVAWVIEKIAYLAEHAKSESVQLAALRSSLSEWFFTPIQRRPVSPAYFALALANFRFPSSIAFSPSWIERTYTSAFRSVPGSPLSRL